jgi:hypothetical protein
MRWSCRQPASSPAGGLCLPPPPRGCNAECVPRCARPDTHPLAAWRSGSLHQRTRQTATHRPAASRLSHSLPGPVSERTCTGCRRGCCCPARWRAEHAGSAAGSFSPRSSSVAAALSGRHAAGPKIYDQGWLVVLAVDARLPWLAGAQPGAPADGTSPEPCDAALARPRAASRLTLVRRSGAATWWTSPPAFPAGAACPGRPGARPRRRRRPRLQKGLLHGPHAQIRPAVQEPRGSEGPPARHT